MFNPHNGVKGRRVLHGIVWRVKSRRTLSKSPRIVFTLHPVLGGRPHCAELFPRQWLSVAKENDMNWQDWFHSEPCSSGWNAFSAALKEYGLEAAVKSAPVSDREWGARNTNREDLLILLATDDHWDVRSAVAQNAQTPAAVLTVLATDDHWDVRSAVAKNAQTPAAVLATLATDASWEVRSAVAKNAQTPAAVLATLATDEDWHVRYARR